MDARLKTALSKANAQIIATDIEMVEKIRAWIFSTPPAHLGEYYADSLFALIEKAAVKLEDVQQSIVVHKSTHLILSAKDIPSPRGRYNDVRKLFIAAEMINTIDGLSAEVSIGHVAGDGLRIQWSWDNVV